MQLKNVTLELSAKPFRDDSDAELRRVARKLFTQWKPLTDRAERISVLLWIADGSEIRRREGALSMSGTTPEGALTLDLPVLLPEGCEVPVIELILN